MLDLWTMMRKMISLCLLCISFSLTNAHSQANEPRMSDPEELKCQILVPSAFSPNNDGINDFLEIRSTCEVQNFSFEVYDLRGRFMFKTSEMGKRWDGAINGTPVPEGYYKWKLTCTKLENGAPRKEIQSGRLAVLR